MILNIAAIKIEARRRKYVQTSTTQTISGLFLYVVYTRFGYLLESYGDMDYEMTVMMVPLSIMTIVGGGISFVGGLVARGNPRNGGIIAIIGSIVGGVNVITLIGGLFLTKGNEFVRPQTSTWEVPPAEEARWKSSGLKRCPVCSAQMPMEARFCPSCGEPFGGEN